MTTDERDIRDLIERWAAAVHRGDLEGVHHSFPDDGS